MEPQTKRNQEGHREARKRGFEATGPGLYGWRDAKVQCVVCGHKLPWYHRRYQLLHRSRCKLPE